MQASNNNTRRLFLALWPQPEIRSQISAWQQSLVVAGAGRASAEAVRPENLHLTLQFLGAVAAAKIAPLSSQLAQLSLPSFELQMHSLGYFASPRVLWLGLATAPPALGRLVAALQAAVAEVLPGPAAELENFIPHISLFKHAQTVPAAPALATISWPVCEFVLVESLQGADAVAYRVLQRWPLC